MKITFITKLLELFCTLFVSSDDYCTNPLYFNKLLEQSRHPFYFEQVLGFRVLQFTHIIIGSIEKNCSVSKIFCTYKILKDEFIQLRFNQDAE